MSAADMLYAKTLRSTDKKMTAEGENEDDDLDCDITDCTVEVSNSDIPDFIDASKASPAPCPPGQVCPFNKSQKKQIKNALDKAEKITADGSCDTALKDYGIASLNALVKQFRSSGSWEGEILDGRDVEINIKVGTHKKTGTPKYEKSTDDSRFPAFVKNGKTYVNSKFFDFSQFASIAQALVLIHEAVHQFGKKKDADFQSSTGSDQTVGSRNLNKILIDECYPAAGVVVKELENL